MRRFALLALFAVFECSSFAQDNAQGPTNEKAQKSYQQGRDYEHQHKYEAAFESFKKADKQDDGHCMVCQKKMIKYGMEFGEWKTAEIAGEEMVGEAQGPMNLALAHYELGAIWKSEGLQRHKDEAFSRAHEEMTKALAAAPNFRKQCLSMELRWRI
jgi:tetratricopeptide (TPR) repeat protein